MEHISVILDRIQKNWLEKGIMKNKENQPIQNNQFRPKNQKFQESEIEVNGEIVKGTK